MTQQQITGATGSLGSGGSLDVYDVPGSVLVTPYSVSATFDGSGAGGAFLPCLTFKTQTGSVIARCPAPEVASGDTAEVSWFPHIAQAAAAAPTGPSALPLAVWKKTGTHTIAAGVDYPVGWDKFETTAPTFYNWHSGSPTTIGIAKAGTYQWWFSLYPDLGSDWPATSAGNINPSVGFSGSGSIEPVIRQVFAGYPQVQYETGSATNVGTLVTTMGVTNREDTSVVTAGIMNNTAGNWTLGIGCFLYIIRLGDNVTF